MNILQILESINGQSARTAKIALIEANKGNKLFLNVLQAALNPYVNYHIRKIPVYEAKGTQTLEWALVELTKLTKREFTGHAGIDHLRNILNSVSSDDAIVVERIIGKDLRCGAGDGTTNVALPGFIPEYPCLLAQPYDEKKIKNITYPAISQLKADGLRVNFHCNQEGGVSICGRSGRDIDLLGEMVDAIAKLGAQFSVPVVFDGELVVIDKNGKLLSRKVGNGIINKGIKGTISLEEAKMVRAQLWDVIPADEFKAGKSTSEYLTRYNNVADAIIEVVDTLDYAPFWIIPSKVVNSLDEAVAHFEELLASGEEGIILKNYCGLWEDTRSNHLVKFKAEKECDLEIIGWNPGNGKYEGMVGSIQMASSDRLVEVNISGFSDPLRAEITRTIDQLMGTIASVIYNERIKSKDKNRANVDSLFLPRFAEFRSDKTVANSSKEIK